MVKGKETSRVSDNRETFRTFVPLLLRSLTEETSVQQSVIIQVSYSCKVVYVVRMYIATDVGEQYNLRIHAARHSSRHGMAHRLLPVKLSSTINTTTSSSMVARQRESTMIHIGIVGINEKQKFRATDLYGRESDRKFYLWPPRSRSLLRPHK